MGSSKEQVYRVAVKLERSRRKEGRVSDLAWEAEVLGRLHKLGGSVCALV